MGGGGRNGLRCWRPISQRAVGSDLVVLAPPSLDENSSLSTRVEQLPVRHDVAELEDLRLSGDKVFQTPPIEWNEARFDELTSLLKR
jgi:hypothetical protein